MIVDKGEDLTDHIENALLSFGKDMWYFRSREGPTTRATNKYFDQNRRFEYLTPGIRISPNDLLGKQEFERPKRLHFICSPTRACEIFSEINLITDWNPLTIYEPIPDSCVHEELPTLTSILPVISILSPNAEEAFALLNITASVTKSSVEAACHRFIELGNIPEHSKSSLPRYVIIRCGSMGACMASSTSSSCIWVGAFWQSSDRDMIKDVTGAGNAFLGGLAAGLALTCDNVYEEETITKNNENIQKLDEYYDKLRRELDSLNLIIENVENLSDNNLQVEPDDKWCLHADGAYKPIGAVESGDVLKPISPFYEEASRRERYLKFILPNPSNQWRSGQNPLEVLPTENEAFLDNLEGLDWSAIARDVSTWNHPGEPRSAQECEGRWLSLHPKLNYEAWTDEETKNLQEIVQNKRSSGDLDWNTVAETLGTSRTGLDCIRQYQACNKTPFKWTDDLDKKLLAAVEKYGYSNWVLVAPAVSLELSPNQCQIRYERTLNPALKHGKFTPEEDELLLRAVEIFGCEWRKVAQMIPGRGNTQCRSRYLSLNRQKERQAKRTEKTSTPTPAPAIEVPSCSNNENIESLATIESTERDGAADTVLPTIVEVAEPPPKKRPKPRPTAVAKSSDTLKSTHSMRTRSTANLT